ncbi:MAG: OmpA family protein [Undibacterium sp.]|nr:OmpA family protein [Undibacterium sp.]
MKTKYFVPSLLAIAIASLVGACSSIPKTTSLLDQTRSDFSYAQNNPNVATYAPLEIKKASESLELANAAAANRDDIEKIDRLAYVAKQQIALAQEVGKQKSAEKEIANAAKERDQVRLDQRTQEANQANKTAEQVKRAEQMALTTAANAQSAAAMAENAAALAKNEANAAQAKNAALEAQLAELAAKKTERGLVITLGDVLFGTNIARLNSDGMRTAQKLANILQQNPSRTVLIEGFTDNVGSDAHNQELSERRANSVSSALISMGVAKERITSRGYGEQHPVASNRSAQDRAQNRRVEIVLSDAQGQLGQRAGAN